MSNRRDQLRASDLADPKTQARTLNDVLRDIQLRLEALERVLAVDVSVVGTASGGTFTIQSPNWPVKGVVLLRCWDATLQVPAYLRISCKQTTGGVAVSLYAGDVSVGTTYDLRVELHG